MRGLAFRVVHAFSRAHANSNHDLGFGVDLIAKSAVGPKRLGQKLCPRSIQKRPNSITKTLALRNLIFLFVQPLHMHRPPMLINGGTGTRVTA